MGWICAPSVQNCIMKFYSIADDIEVMNQAIFQFLISLSPGVLSTIIIVFLVTFIIAILLSIKAGIREIGKI